LLGLAAALVTAWAAPAAAAPADGDIRLDGGPTAVAGSFIVVLKPTAAVSATAATLAARFGGTVGHSYSHALRGFEARMSKVAARRLAADPAVAYVQQNHTVHLVDTQSPVPSWGLDRIDQRNRPLDNSFTYPTIASGVKAYIIDTGLRFSHTTFQGRAVSGFDAIDGGTADDCHGHGTHVGGTTGGFEYGVAKGVTLVGVRVLDCAGSGTFAQVIAGIDWVTGDHAAGQPAVANMSLGGPADTATDTAVSNSVADGVTYAIAAGNSNANACNFSPARTPTAITVGATDINDNRASFSNFGTCLDIFAPGVNITSSWMTSDTATNTISGTSMATPHVAGAAALVLGQNAGLTPAQVTAALVDNATVGVVVNPGTGSPNRLLFVVNGAPADDFSISVTPNSGSVPAGGGSVSATVNTATTSGSPQSVALSAAGLPAGSSATFVPSTVTSGGSSALTITTTAATPAGTFPVTITGTGTSATHSTTFTLFVAGGGGSCSGTNATDVSIPDTGVNVFSNITISGCGRAPSATSTIEVHIIHTYRGDLIINLIAPDGTAYLLKNWNFFDSADNVHTTYIRNLSGELPDGTWRLRVRDVFGGDVGFIDSWTLTL
jgi:subtilisin family serine protease